MITNEKQYRITRARLGEFAEALANAQAELSNSSLHPKLAQAQCDGLLSVVEELQEQISEYESLRAAKLPVIRSTSFDQFGSALIKARIAAGLSQRALADRLGIKEQQIQRYEADGYQSASFRRLNEVADAIGVRVENNVLVPIAATNFDGVVKKLAQVGLSEGFIFDRLLPTTTRAIALGEVSAESSDLATGTLAEILRRIYGWTPDELVGTPPLSPPRVAAAEARFKIPKGAASKKIGLEATYANYLAVAVLNAVRKVPVWSVPTDPKVVWSNICDASGEMSLRAALHYIWDLGIPVLPLKGSSGFHGACWRYEGRNVIVLKQNTQSESRWLFDLMHEFCHAGQHPELDTMEIVEADEASAERRESADEIAASRFAGAVLLKGEAERLTSIAVKKAGGSVERLKSVVPKVAQDGGVSTDALANYIAFRLSMQKINWWGAATNLQKSTSDPWNIARDVFFERFSFEMDDSVDRLLLEAALR